MFASFKQFGDSAALIGEHGDVISYAALDAMVDNFAARFTAGRGVFLLECDTSAAAIVAFVAAFRARQPVMLAAAGDVEAIARLKNVYSVLYHYRPHTDELVIEAGAGNVRVHPDLAVLLSTSGSTGASKCVRLSYENIESNASAIANYLELTPADRAMSVLPLQYSYRISVVTSYLATGASIVLTNYSIIDAEFWELFDKYQCTSFAGVPHTFDLLEKIGVVLSQHPSLRYATQAGGKLAPEKVTRLAKRAEREGWRFFVMYGQTEAAPRMAYLPPEDAAKFPDCIGRPIPGGEFTLVDENGAELTSGKGELVYRGPNVMMGYANGDADLALGREIDALHTGDLAERATENYYRIVGRKGRFIKPFGLRINLDEVEARLAAKDISAAAAGHEEVLWVFVDDPQKVENVATDLMRWLGAPADAVRVEALDSLPRNKNGKIDYPALNEIIAARADGRDWGDRLLATPRRLIARLTGGGARETNVREVFEKHFPGATINDTDTFIERGGDSLSYISMAIDLEAAIGRLPADWPSTPLSALESRGRGASSDVARIDMAVFLRAAAIFMVIAGHLHFIKYPGGGATLLIAVAGFTFASFQLPRVIETGSPWPVASLLLRAAAPTMAYLLLLSFVIFEFDYRILFLHSNFYSPYLKGGYAFWFIEVYVQILAIIIALFSFPPLRNSFASRPFRASIIFSILTIALFVIAHQLWNTHYLYRRLPHMLIWLFAIGMTAQFAKTTGERIIATGLYILGGVLFSGAELMINWMTYGVLALIWIRQVVFPRWAARLIVPVAGASLFIYLTHFQFGNITQKVVPGEPFLAVLVALVGGVAVWRAYEAGVGFLRRALVATGKRHSS